MLYTASSQCCQPYELLQSSITPYGHLCQSDFQHRKMHIGTDRLKIYLRKKIIKQNKSNQKICIRMEKDTEKMQEILCE